MDRVKRIWRSIAPYHAGRLRPLRALIALCAAGFVLWLAWPCGDLFTGGYSTLVFGSDGGLLRATLASDGQFRFPPGEAPLPEKYRLALVTSEDKRFFSHPGVDLLALVHAAYVNVRSGRRVRGGSTITMQVARLSRPRPRTYATKLIECLRALKLSLHFSKEEILELYEGHVPMGGNIVGLEAASRLYLGKPMEELTWAEAALFTLLPNEPSRVNLSRNRAELKWKRDRLLELLGDRNVIDRITCEMSRAEPLPSGDRHFPFSAPHFTTMILERTDRPGGRVTTTLDGGIQRLATEAALMHGRILADQGIENLALIVVETGTGRIRAYIGSQDFYDDEHGGQVDGVLAFRSTGSLLKPFLVAKALDRGPYTIKSRIMDVPTFYGTFAPQNASKEFSGLASLDRVLVESLNVPSVRFLNAYGLGDFYDFLVQAGLMGLFRSPDGYGLSLVIGGAEANLMELTQLYAGLANLGESRPLAMIEEAGAPRPRKRLFSEGAAWLVLDALGRLERPGIERYWDRFDGGLRVAWKTGTSYGQKDAWAIGVNRQWTIGVWAGNFTGEGNANIGGVGSAAPLLFDLFNALTEPGGPVWFDEPHHDLKEVLCCKESGYPAGPYCPERVAVDCPRRPRSPGVCPYHRRYLVDAETGREVCSLCWDGVSTRWDTLFVVPPGVRELLAAAGRRVDSVPAHAMCCPTTGDLHRIELVYPVEGVKILVPRDYDGSYEKVVFSAKHQRPGGHLFWYLDGMLIGETSGTHELPVDLEEGAYTLTVQDEEGFRRSVSFEAYRNGAPREQRTAGATLPPSSSPPPASPDRRASRCP
jgi:penicillin-binding protein 1C